MKSPHAYLVSAGHATAIDDLSAAERNLVFGADTADDGKTGLELLEAALADDMAIPPVKHNPPPSTHGGLTGTALLTAALNEEFTAVRPATLAEITRRGEAHQPSPWEQLFEISQAITTNEGVEPDPAFQLATERNPLLFQQWQDSLPKPSGTAMLQAALAEEFEASK